MFTMKFACSVEICARPEESPLQPQASTSLPAEPSVGLRNTEPQVGLPMGWVRRRRARRDSMSAEIAARSPFFRAKVASRMISLVGIEVQR